MDKDIKTSCGIVAGRRGLLVRKAPKLFAHALDVIRQTSLASPLGQDYSALLRNSLLTMPQYCDAAGSLLFQGSCLSCATAYVAFICELGAWQQPESASGVW